MKTQQIIVLVVICKSHIVLNVKILVNALDVTITFLLLLIDQFA